MTNNDSLYQESYNKSLLIQRDFFINALKENKLLRRHLKIICLYFKNAQILSKNKDKINIDKAADRMANSMLEIVAMVGINPSACAIMYKDELLIEIEKYKEPWWIFWK